MSVTSIVAAFALEAELLLELRALVLSRIHR